MMVKIVNLSKYQIDNMISLYLVFSDRNPIRFIKTAYRQISVCAFDFVSFIMAVNGKEV